jgi:ribosomal protein S18 acetylase RimI-like enzyme
VPAPLQEPTIRRATVEDHPRVAETLARAFVEDPAWAHLLPDRGDRERRLRRFFDAELRHLAPERLELWMTDDGAAAGAWSPPGRWVVPLGTMIRQAPEMLRVFGRRLPLALRSGLSVERRHPRRPRHWYLHYLGAVPERQGRGLGSALMGPMLELCDRERIPAYLESSTERNRALYERHGFELVETFDMPGSGPPLRRMWRRPRAVTPTAV